MARKMQRNADQSGRGRVLLARGLPRGQADECLPGCTTYTAFQFWEGLTQAGNKCVLIEAVAASPTQDAPNWPGTGSVCYVVTLRNGLVFRARCAYVNKMDDIVRLFPIFALLIFALVPRRASSLLPPRRSTAASASASAQRPTQPWPSNPPVVAETKQNHIYELSVLLASALRQGECADSWKRRSRRPHPHRHAQLELAHVGASSRRGGGSPFALAARRSAAKRTSSPVQCLSRIFR